MKKHSILPYIVAGTSLLLVIGMAIVCYDAIVSYYKYKSLSSRVERLDSIVNEYEKYN